MDKLLLRLPPASRIGAFLYGRSRGGQVIAAWDKKGRLPYAAPSLYWHASDQAVCGLARAFLIWAPSLYGRLPGGCAPIKCLWTRSGRKRRRRLHGCDAAQESASAGTRSLRRSLLGADAPHDLRWTRRFPDRALRRAERAAEGRHHREDARERGAGGDSGLQSRLSLGAVSEPPSYPDLRRPRCRSGMAHM